VTATTTATAHETRGPLHGLRVLDLGTMIAGPVAATLLGDFGAEVLKVEQPQGGDPMRGIGPFASGESLWFNVESRNKKSLSLDLRLPEGQALLRDLARHADVLVENFRPGTMARWGLDHAALAAVNSRLVMLSTSGFGQTGPNASRGGYDRIGLAFGGLMHVTGHADRPPVKPGNSMADYQSALFGAMSVMMALYHRDVHGASGQLIDINLIDPLARLLEQTLLGYDQLGLVPTRAGNRWDISAPRNTYRTADGRWLAMSGSSPQLALRVFRAIGRADLVDDADFSDPQRRLARAREVDQVVADWVATKTLAEAMQIFDAAEVAAAPVYDITDLVADEQLAHREVFVKVGDDELGAMTVQAPVPRFSGATGRVQHLGPRIGEHNAQVYGELLGLTGGNIDDLHTRGVL
jgi:crotonobetainyl-CoA:carnitine CoA-transferase CaiB-like acyl-CoA transferase